VTSLASRHSITSLDDKLDLQDTNHPEVCIVLPNGGNANGSTALSLNPLLAHQAQLHASPGDDESGT
jgi:hypothetical protein